MLSKILLASGLIGTVFLAGCTPTPETTESTVGSETAQTTSDSVAEPDAMEGEDVMMAEADREITVDMFMFGYSEEEIMVTPGETIKVNLTNSEGMHDFDVDELGVDGDVIAEGETTSVILTIPEDAQAGTEYAYYCSVGNHREQGMEGTIIVE